MSPEPSRQPKAPARPRQVTVATILSVGGSLMLLIGLVDTLGRLRTPETREAVDDLLAGPPGSTLGLDTAQVVDTMRAIVYVSAALGAAALVLGIFLLQRHRGARVGLTVIAGLLLVTAPVAGLMPLFVAAGAGFAWSRPARDWFAGRPAESRPRSHVPAESSHPPPAAPTAAGSPPPTQPPPPGQPPPSLWDPPPAAPPGSHPYGQPAGLADTPPAGRLDTPPGVPPIATPGAPPAHLPPTGPERRPATVTVAAILTWVGAGGVAALSLLTALVLAASAEAFVDQLDEALRPTGVTVSPDEALAIGWSVTAVMLGWSLVSVLLAVSAFRRSNAGRVGLAVSATLTALVSLLLILSLISVVPLLLAGATAVLLFTGGANEWYSRRPSQTAHPEQRQGPW